MEIHCGNLPFSFGDAQLRTTFEPFGTVESASVVLHKYTNQPRGFGFVSMPNSEEAKKAIAALDGSDIDGRKLRVSAARPERKFGNQGPSSSS